ncbi:hypothetical protein [Streptomyces scabiei]|uniref:hypothetical protein n=2 Tax=Streptomyces scabiei TaxID=1930 RepID=UPI000AA493A6|nr:hypothetical protein [Streptomyces scabiei]MDX2833919.1 hypothetical protein [Streptomyces scabiei]MDX3678284.1 hypothetical protein [Streptomyces scabiei]
MAARNRDRTVHFYEIAGAKEPNSRMEHGDWGARIRGLRDVPIPQRTVESAGETLIGAVDPNQPDPHLLLAKVRKDVPQQINYDDGSFSYLQLAANRGLVDVTTVYFLSFGNVVATMGGGISAPRVQAIQRWLNGMRLTSEEILLRPVVDARSRDKLARANAVERLTIRVQPEAHDSPSALRSSSDIGTAISRMHEEYPDMTITLTLEVPKKPKWYSVRRRSRGHRQLLDSTSALAADIGDWLDNTDAVDIARAEAHIEEWNQQATDEKIDFVAERVTAKCRVPLESTDGHSIDLHVALTELARVAREHERTLRAAVGADV